MRTLRRNGLKGQRANSPRHRLVYRNVGHFALKGQKPTYSIAAFALSGRWLRTVLTQGDALGWEFYGLSGRLCGT